MCCTYSSWKTSIRFGAFVGELMVIVPYHRSYIWCRQHSIPGTISVIAIETLAGSWQVVPETLGWEGNYFSDWVIFKWNSLEDGISRGQLSAGGSVGQYTKSTMRSTYLPSLYLILTLAAFTSCTPITQSPVTPPTVGLVEPTTGRRVEVGLLWRPCWSRFQVIQFRRIFLGIDAAEPQRNASEDN